MLFVTRYVQCTHVYSTYSLTISTVSVLLPSSLLVVDSDLSYGNMVLSLTVRVRLCSHAGYLQESVDLDYTLNRDYCVE